MSGLVRADTALMLAAAAEMQRVSGLMQEQFAAVHQAMQEMQSSRWSGRHRDVLEDSWAIVLRDFSPTQSRLEIIGLRLKLTADALDEASREFGGFPTISGTDAFLDYVKATALAGAEADLRRLQMSLIDPSAGLGAFLGGQIGQWLAETAKDLFDPSLASTDTSASGIPPRIFVINGINSRALPGFADPSAKLLEARLEALGYDRDDVVATQSVYNSNVPNMGVNSLVGVAQVLAEHGLGTNGVYTQQTLREIEANLQNNPLLPGQGVVIIGHSGGGAIASNLVKELEGRDVDVQQLVTMGSPVGNFDTASQYANVLSMRDQYDMIGLPILRSDEVSKSLFPALATLSPAMYAVQLLRDQSQRTQGPHIVNETTHSGKTGVVDAHTSYWSSNQVIEYLKQHNPAIAQGLSGGAPAQPASPVPARGR